MTLDKFRSFESRMQVTTAFMRGTYLAYRWEEDGKVMLYHLDDGNRDFFVEMVQDDTDQRAVVLRSFSDLEALEEYAQRVRLPQKW